MKTHFLAILVMVGLIPFYPAIASADSDFGDTNTDNISKIINCDKNQNNLPEPPKVPAYTWKGSGLITLWFDDSWKTAYTNGLPLMKQYGYRGAVAVAVKLVCYPEFMNWDQLRELQNLGWETTAHSVTHNCDLGYYTTKTTEYELHGSKQMIQGHGLRADHFVMPCGFNSQDIEALFENNYPPIIADAKQNFQSYRTTHYQRINPIPVPDPYNLNAFQIRSTTTDREIQDMINKAVAQHGWLIIVIHQIDNTGRPFSITEAKFKKTLEMIKASHLPVILPTQALDIRK